MVQKQRTYSKGLSKSQVKKAVKQGLKTDSITKRQHRVSGDAVLEFKKSAEAFVKALTGQAFFIASAQRRKGLRLKDIDEAVLELKYPFSMKTSVPALRTKANKFSATYGLSSASIRKLMKASVPQVAQISPKALPRVAIAILSFLQGLAEGCDSIASIFNRKTVKANLVRMLLHIALSSTTA